MSKFRDTVWTVVFVAVVVILTWWNTIVRYWYDKLGVKYTTDCGGFVTRVKSNSPFTYFPNWV